MQIISPFVSMFEAIAHIQRVTQNKQGWRELEPLLAHGVIRAQKRWGRHRHDPPIPWNRARWIGEHGVWFDPDPYFPLLSLRGVSALGLEQPPPEPVQIDIFGADLLKYWPNEKVEADTASGDEAKRAGETAPLPANVVPFVKKSRRAAPGKGRPLPPHWREVRTMIFARLEDDGVPTPGDGEQAALETSAKDILAKREIHPSESTIRRHVVRYIGEYRQTLNG